MSSLLHAVPARSRILRVFAVAAIAALATLSGCTGAAAAAAGATEWNFAASLDGTQIGTHRFVVRSGPGDMDVRELRSVARFDVKVLGLTVYSYRHQAEEQWRGNCLESMSARTDDDGRVTDVRGRATRGGFALDVRGAERRGSGPREAADGTECLMSFAYWNPGIARQTRLLDPGTGRVEAVTITVLPPTSLVLRGRQVSARGLRISGLTHPIDVWYLDDEWVGLDTSVDGGRRLSYRLL